MNTIVWSRDNCVHCINAKKLLELKNIPYEERKIGEGYTREDLLAILPEAKTVPQIFLQGEYIGGFDKLRERLK